MVTRMTISFEGRRQASPIPDRGIKPKGPALLCVNCIPLANMCISFIYTFARLGLRSGLCEPPGLRLHFQGYPNLAAESVTPGSRTLVNRLLRDEQPSLAHMPPAWHDIQPQNHTTWVPEPGPGGEGSHITNQYTAAARH